MGRDYDIDPQETRHWFEDVLRPQGPMKWIGDEGKCRCPFHEDKAPSFGVNAKKGTWVCYAGCGGGGLTDLAKRLGVDSPLRRESSDRLSRIETRYDYRGEDGKVLYQVVRVDGPEGKKIWQRRPDGNGGWVNNLKGISPVPYRLPELVEALGAGKIVFVAEGEKCVDRLVALGVVATTNHGGAKKWRDGHSAWFPAGSRVHILPDSDEPGRDHALQVASALAVRGCHVKVLDLGYPLTQGHGRDVADWLDAGHSLEDLRDLIRHTPEWGSGADAVSSSPGTDIEEATPERQEKPKVRTRGDAASYKTVGGYLQNDIGNGERMVALFGKDLRYCHRWKKWLCWDGRRWAEDAPHLVARLSAATVRSMYPDADSLDDDGERKRFLDFITNSGRKSRMDAMIAVAASGDGIPCEPGELDQGAWLLNCRNGTLDLKTGTLRAHAREDLITKLSPVEFDFSSACPAWEKFLLRIMNGNEEMVGFLRRAVGYSLTGSTREHCLFMLYGTGRNGKSTFLNVLRQLLGDYGRQAAADTFMAKRTSSGPGDDVAALRGARFVTAIETEETQRLAESLVKQLTGGDSVSCRRLYENFFEFQPEFKIYLATNHKPNIRGTDEGIWRRVRLVPFTVRIPDEEVDPDLPTKLQSEFSGILSWAVRGCLEWQEHGLMEPREVLASTEDYRREMDTVGAFLGDRCSTGREQAVGSGDLYRAYTEWCEDNGERAFSQRMLAKRLTERGFLVHRGSGGRRLWAGLGLKNLEHDWESDACDASKTGDPLCVTQQTLGITGEVTLSDQVTLFSKDLHVNKKEGKAMGGEGYDAGTPHEKGNLCAPVSVTSVTSLGYDRENKDGKNFPMRHFPDGQTSQTLAATEEIIIPWEDDPEERRAIQDEV